MKIIDCHLICSKEELLAFYNYCNLVNFNLDIGDVDKNILEGWPEVETEGFFLWEHELEIAKEFMKLYENL